MKTIHIIDHSAMTPRFHVYLNQNNNDKSLASYHTYEVALEAAKEFAKTHSARLDVETATSSSSIINSLKRLERAGDDSSKANQKLRDAAAQVAGKIIELVPEGELLPRGYRVAAYSGKKFLFISMLELYEREMTQTGWCRTRAIVKENVGYYLDQNRSVYLRVANHAHILNFATNVAEGLLDEIAAWLKARANADSEAEAILLTS